MTYTTSSAYEQSVFAWGNEDPWKAMKIRVSHRDKFFPTDILTDGYGNILAIPQYRGKPCFARPEVYLRHGKGVEIRKVRGKLGEYPNRCAKCPINRACKAVAAERIKSSSEIIAAVQEWHSFCQSYGRGKPIYAGGPFADKWVAVKRAIANHGGWTNVNDAFVRDDKAQEMQRKIDAAKDRKRKQRAKQRLILQAQHALPDDLLEATIARHDRELRLVDLWKQGSTLRCINKIQQADLESTARLTADAWLARYLLTEKGEKATPASIASFLKKYNRDDGKSYDTLKARIKTDLARVDALEACGDWEPYDPNADLHDWTLEDFERDDRYGDQVDSEQANEKFLRQNWW